jgi:shikimate dehydrogenase
MADPLLSSPSDLLADRRVLTGLVGSPIKHSASPAMHEWAGLTLGLRLHYHLIDIPGLDTAGLRAVFDGIRRLGFAGVNVTFPYKEAVVGLLDALSPQAAAMGAVNTVVVRDGRLTGHNTDATGFARAARPLVEASDRGAVALIGAGGVGKAIGFALAELGVRELRIVETDAAKAAALARALDGRIAVQLLPDAAAALAGAVGLVNGTPVGMLPNRDTPVAPALLHDRLWVADAVYSPLWTPLLKAAAACGANTMTGRDLAVFQAADAFELFTGIAPDAAEMAKAFDAVMAKRMAATGAA